MISSCRKYAQRGCRKQTQTIACAEGALFER